MEGQFKVLSELIVQLSHEPLSVPERNCSAFFSSRARGQIKLMLLERLLLVNKPIAENSETLVNPQSQKGLPRILIVLMAAQQTLENLSPIRINTNFYICYFRFYTISANYFMSISVL